MRKFGRFISKNRILVLVIAVVLIIPAIYGMVTTTINYDMLTYLPQELDSMKGQEILDKEFSNAATSMLIMEKMDSKDVVKIKDKISKVKGVDKVIWIDDLLDTSVPSKMIPDEVKDVFYSENSTMLIVKFKDSASSEVTQTAIENIRGIANKQCFLSGASAIVKDTKDLADDQTPWYVLLAVVLCTILLSLTMESVIIPFIFLLGIGIAVLYNLGTNTFLGNISYVTKAIAAVLQLGVSMDFSIFLYHRYTEEKNNFAEKEEAMAEAISKTMVAISSSCLTTVAGFLTLCTMKLSLGTDIGIVMAKGMVFAFISTITILPALILIFDKPISRFQHKSILPSFKRTSNFVTKHYRIMIAIFLLAFIPATFGKLNAKQYYNLDESLPRDLPSIVATNKLKADYDMTTTHFIIVDKNVEPFKIKEMTEKIEKLDGINKVAAFDKYVGGGIPESFIPDDIKSNFVQDKHKLIIANSTYKAATDELNDQVDEVNKIAKSYDKKAMITGEGALTKDLIKIAEKDFVTVDTTSILVIAIIITLAFMSISLPIILVGSIELAIFVNMAIPFYTGTAIPFVAGIVIGTIQLGSTIDYAVLMTTRFKEEMAKTEDKFEAMRITVQGTAGSITTSALAFFAATLGVSLISDMEIVKVLATMMARGAIISMFVIILILPSILLVCEKPISFTTRKWRKKQVSGDVKFVEEGR